MLMQMDNVFFWGILIILTGVTLLVRVILNVDFPVLRIIAGSFLILLGIMIISGSSGVWPLKTAENELFFKSSLVKGTDQLSPEYHLVFSHTVFDLTGFDLPDKEKNLKINNIFSGSTVLMDPDLPVNIEVDAMFAGVKMPGRNTPLFGRGVYTSDGFDPEGPHLNISVNIVFGNIVFMHKP